MIGIFFGSLVIAGIFMFVPGRIMYSVAFGQCERWNSIQKFG